MIASQKDELYCDLQDYTFMIEASGRTLIRFYLHFGGLYKKLYWFEMKDGDLYWGSSSKTKDIEPQTFKPGDVLTIPSEIDHLPDVSKKNSYHLSGVVHEKVQEGSMPPKYVPHNIWKLKEDIKKPTSFFALITRPLKEYKKGISKPKHSVEKNEYCIVINCKESEQALSSRMYLEFFLAPIGLHPYPKAMLFGYQLDGNFSHKLAPDLQLMVTFTLTSSLGDMWPNY